MSRDPTCDVNMHILENPRWPTARVFQLKYLSSEARYEKSVNGVVSYSKSSFKLAKNIFCCHYLVLVLVLLLPLPSPSPFVAITYLVLNLVLV